MSHETEDPFSAFTASLAASGIDIVQFFDVRWYNSYIQDEGLPLKPLNTLGRKSGTVAALLGNTSALWPAFLSWLAAQPDAGSISDPLDAFVSATIHLAVALTGEKRHDIIWPWEGGDRLCSMQRVAICSGLCYHDSETQLVRDVGEPRLPILGSMRHPPT